MVSGSSIKPMLRAFVAAMLWFMKCETMAFGRNRQKTFRARLAAGTSHVALFSSLERSH